MLDGALKGLITGAVVALVFGLIGLLGWLVGGGARKGSDGAVVLRYGGAFRGLGVLSMLIVLGLSVALLVSLLGVDLGDGAAMALLLMIGLFGGLGLPLTIEAFRRRVVMDDDGLTGRGWFGTGETIHWAEIVSVENKVMGGKFVVRTDDAKLSLSHYLEGLNEFAEECKARLEPEVYGKAFDKPINRPFL